MHKATNLYYILHYYSPRLGLANGSGRVMGQNGFGPNGSIKKGQFWFGSKRVRIRTGTGWNGFWIGLVKNVFFKEIVHQGAILFGSKWYWSKRYGSKRFASKRYASKRFDSKWYGSKWFTV
ncbi:hypothetical protein Hanom_Chr13g01221771 [Helianthus anomalus]